MARRRLFSVHAFVLAMATPALCFSQSVPLWALENWKLHNEDGLNALKRGKYDRAEKDFRQAIKEIQGYEPANRNLMARTYCDLARVFYNQERYADAEPLAKWSLSVRDAGKKTNSDLVFQSLFLLASIQTAEEHYADAEPNFRRALSIQEKELTANHVNTLDTLERLALVLRSQAKYQEAEPLYRRAIAIHERRAPEENIDLANMIDQYVILLRRMKRVEEAEQWAARALRIRDKAATKSVRAKAERPSEKLKGYK